MSNQTVKVSLYPSFTQGPNVLLNGKVALLPSLSCSVKTRMQSPNRVM
jgi:hypothetical protein